MRSDVLRVLARVFLLLAVAPPLPSDLWPGARTLPDSFRRRLPSPAMPSQVTARPPRGAGVLDGRPASGTRMMAIPVDGGRPVPPRLPAALPGPVIAAAPWGEPLVPFAGVTVSTCLVPEEWLRPGTQAAAVIQVSRGRPALVTAPPVTATPPLTPPLPVAPPASSATITQFPQQPRPWPGTVAGAPVRRQPQSRFRRAAVLALGLVVSLVALEAATRKHLV